MSRPSVTSQDLSANDMVALLNSHLVTLPLQGKRRANVFLEGHRSALLVAELPSSKDAMDQAIIIHRLPSRPGPSTTILFQATPEELVKQIQSKTRNARDVADTIISHKASQAKVLLGGGTFNEKFRGFFRMVTPAGRTEAAALEFQERMKELDLFYPEGSREHGSIAHLSAQANVVDLFRAKLKAIPTDSKQTDGPKTAWDKYSEMTEQRAGQPKDLSKPTTPIQHR
jgi:hypothetical protein